MSVIENARRRVHALLRRTKDDSGAMALALLTIVALGAIALTITTVIAWQVKTSRSEQETNRASWAIESNLNRAAEKLGATGHSLGGIPFGVPTEWQTGSDGRTANRWWVSPVGIPEATKVLTPANTMYTASNGTMTLAVDADGNTYTSADGAVWTHTGHVPSGVNVQNITQLTYGYGHYILVEAPASNDTELPPVRTSVDGIRWTTSESPGFITDAGTEKLLRVACSPTQCVLIATVPGTETRYFVSSDLSAWELTASTQVMTSLTVAEDVAYGANRFVVVGFNASAQQNQTSFSTDGSSWSAAIPVSSTTTKVHLNRVTYVNGTFDLFSAGPNGSIYSLPLIWRGYIQASKTFYHSSDALSWTADTLPVAAHWTDIQSNGTTVIAISEGGLDTAALTSQPSSIFIVSTDGVNWQTRSLPSAERWDNLAQMGQSWMLSTPYSKNAYVVSSRPDLAGLPSQVLVTAQQKVTATGTVYEGSMLFNWEARDNHWHVTKWFPETKIGHTTDFTLNANAAADAPETITFTDASTGDIATHVWDFGDGSPLSYDVNPSHTYTTPGTYTVTHTTLQGASVAVSAQKNITITGVSSSPINVAAVAVGTNGDMTVTWDPPIDDGGHPVTDYRVEIQTKNGSWLVVAHDPSTALSLGLTGLIPGDTYNVRVRAGNAAGWSEPSDFATLVLPKNS